jgi:hypothetical protein
VAIGAADLAASVRAAGAVAAKLTIYRIPVSLQTLLGVTPDALESFPDVRIDEIDDAATIGAAIDAIVQSQPEPSDDPLDARFGLVFTNRAGERVLAVYKGRFALSGQIDDAPCDFEEFTLHEWLTARYP